MGVFWREERRQEYGKLPSHESDPSNYRIRYASLTFCLQAAAAGRSRCRREAGRNMVSSVVMSWLVVRFTDPSQFVKLRPLFVLEKLNLDYKIINLGLSCCHSERPT